jgi:uncharacterized membrane protein YkvA (DUF1232 family)
VDAIPDIIPIVGLTDDAAIITGAIATVLVHIKPEHKANAAKTASQWFD